MTGYAQLNKATPESFKITDISGYPSLQFYDSATDQLRGGIVETTKQGRLSARSYSIGADGKNIVNANGSNVYSNYVFPKSTITSGIQDYNIITTQNPQDITKLIYPVNSVYTTSTNSNPSSYLGGTWQLINKQFIPLATNTDSLAFLTQQTANVTATKNYIYRNGQSITFGFRFTPKDTVTLEDTTINLAKIKPNVIGISGFTTSRYFQLASDAAEGIALCRLYVDSDHADHNMIQIVDTVGTQGKTGLTAGSVLSGEITFTFSQNYMLDAACNQFIWQRTE